MKILFVKKKKWLENCLVKEEKSFKIKKINFCCFFLFRNALLLLKRKKFTEILMIRIDVQLDKVERLVRDMETVQLNQDVFSSLKNGNEALQKLNEVFKCF